MGECEVSLGPDCRLRGKVTFTRDGSSPVRAFLGVPYALAPVGPRRFLPPEMLPLWTGTKPATEYGEYQRPGTRREYLTASN